MKPKPLKSKKKNILQSENIKKYFQPQDENRIGNSKNTIEKPQILSKKAFYVNDLRERIDNGIFFGVILL